MTYYANGGKSYEQILDEQIQDEAIAGPLYEHMALLAEQKGMRVTAELIRSIAKDEDKHYGMLTDIKVMPEAIIGAASSESPAGAWYRAFGERIPYPTTVEDWSELAYKMYDRLLDDPAMRGSIMYYLHQIQDDPWGAANAKLWLTVKAGELGLG